MFHELIWIPAMFVAQAGGANADAAAAEAAASAVQVQSVWDFVVKGGPVMIPIGLCSLAALALFVERLISLRREHVIPAGFIPGLKSLLKKNPGDREAALEYCRRNPSALSRVLAAAVKRLGEPRELLERHVQEAGEREAVRLRKYMRALSVIASVAPLLGLLGTITGMITAFQTVAASGEALGRTELLAKGIYEAMITTAAGLIVAIPVLVAYHWVAGRVDRLVGEIDAKVVDFVEEIAVTSPAKAGVTHAIMDGQSARSDVATLLPAVRIDA